MAPSVRLFAPALASLVFASCAPGERATIYHGGPIITMDATSPSAEAILVVGDRIVAVGTFDEVRAHSGNDARVVDLNGEALLPGFIDAHGHFPGMGLYALHANLNSPPIGQIETIKDIVGVLRERASVVRTDNWLFGLGYDDTLLTEHRHPTRQDLDRASIEHPIAAVHISGHLAVANTRALEILGIDAHTADPSGGRIRRDSATGMPTGVLEESAARGVLERLQNPSLLESIRILRAASEAYVRTGVTTAQNGLATRRQLRLLSLASRLGLVPLRLVLWPNADVGDAILAGTIDTDTYDANWVRIGAVKLVADGSIQGYTGYLAEPYFVPPDQDPGYRGYPRMQPQELARRLEAYHRSGLQVAVHGNGDAAIEMILDAVEMVDATLPRGDARHVIVHAQMARDDQLDRMKRLGVIPSFFSLHTYYWGDRHRDVFMGPERAARMSPAGTALRKGIRFTIHSDAPVVPMEPLRLVWSAVNRRTTSGRTIGQRERVDVSAALRAVTIDAAYQHFEEHTKGSLEPGKLADLVILSASPLEQPESLDRIEVVETIVGGRTVYRRP